MSKVVKGILGDYLSAKLEQITQSEGMIRRFEKLLEEEKIRLSTIRQEVSDLEEHLKNLE